MKNKILLTAILAITLTSSNSFAKKNEIDSKTEKNLIESIGDKKDSREEIGSLDFSKLFSDTEAYFKAAKSWKKIKCEPKSGFICSKHACNKKDTSTFVILDKTKETITRCEGKYCETFPATFSQTGVFSNIQSEGPVGTLIRVLGDNRYKEITTVGLDAYIANGVCEAYSE